jgi:hypothetical protein
MNESSNLPLGGGEPAVPPDRVLAQAARSLANLIRTSQSATDPAAQDEAMLLSLHHDFVTDGNSTMVLFLQSRTLDAVFHRMLQCGFATGDDNAIDDDRVKLALQAQHQCRNVINGLSIIRKRELETEILETRKSENELKAYENRNKNKPM